MTSFRKPLDLVKYIIYTLTIIKPFRRNLMNSKWMFLFASAIVLFLILSGCTPSGTPTCPTASLQAPILTSPAMWSVVGSLSPSLSWSYPDASCNP